MPSSVIRRYSYDPESRRLRVHFVSGAVYDYEAVPPGTVQGLDGAVSKGRYFGARIRERFRYVRVLSASGVQGGEASASAPAP